MCPRLCIHAMMRTRTGRNLFVQVSQQMVWSNVLRWCATMVLICDQSFLKPSFAAIDDAARERAHSNTSSSTIVLRGTIVVINWPGSGDSLARCASVLLLPSFWRHSRSPSALPMPPNLWARQELQPLCPSRPNQKMPSRLQ